MSTRNDIAELAARFRKAVADGEAWKAAGSQERYLEAFFLAEGLEAEMLKRVALERIDHEAPKVTPGTSP